MVVVFIVAYINHPIGVAWILINEANISDTKVIQAAILHDTVEDTDTTFEELEQVFGAKVMSIVKECSDDKSLPSHQRKAMQIEHASHISYEAKLVKLADKLYNLRDLKRSVPVGWTVKRVQEYFSWAKKVTDGLGNANQNLTLLLNEVFENGTFEFEGTVYPCLVK